MAKINRYAGDLKAFASGATGTNRTLFGEVTQADDLTSQITADFLLGWQIVGPSDQPTLQDFNAVGYTHGQLLAYLHQAGVPEHDMLQEYSLNSICNASGLLFKSLSNGNIGNDPLTLNSNWEPVGVGASSVAMTGSNVTLTAAQAAVPVIIITGVLTANVQLIFPAYKKNWTVINNTTAGGFTVTCKTAAGSGVAVTSRRTVVGDGVNILTANADLPSGSLIGFKVLTTGGASTYTPTAGTNSVIVEAVGGGGAGGGAPATGAGAASIGAGGGAGAYAKARFTSGFSGVTVTVGNGGNGVSGGGGQAGGATTFGGLLTCPGGFGGAIAGPSGSYFFTFTGISSGASGGNIEAASGGGSALAQAIDPTSLYIGAAGASRFGPGANATGATATGGASPTNGAGGGGTGRTASQGAGTGGAGGAGKVIIWEYA